MLRRAMPCRADGRVRPKVAIKALHRRDSVRFRGFAAVCRRRAIARRTGAAMNGATSRGRPGDGLFQAQFREAKPCRPIINGAVGLCGPRFKYHVRFRAVVFVMNGLLGSHVPRLND